MQTGCSQVGALRARAPPASARCALYILAPGDPSAPFGTIVCTPTSNAYHHTSSSASAFIGGVRTLVFWSGYWSDCKYCILLYLSKTKRSEHSWIYLELCKIWLHI